MWEMAMKVSTSLAAKAFQFTQGNSGDYWDYLEHIEAPQWIDLAFEASLHGTEGDDPWFYKHHPHHETPLEELVFFPGRKMKDKLGKQFEEDELEFKCDALKTSQKIDEAHRSEQGRIKAKRVEMLPGSGNRIGKQDHKAENGNRNDSGKQENHKAEDLNKSDGGKQENHKAENNGSPLRPSDAFSTKLLATLMARLKTSEEMQATTLNENQSHSDSKLENHHRQHSSPEIQSSVLNVRKLRLRTSISTTVPLPGATKGSSSATRTTTTTMKRERHEQQHKSSPLRGDKENTKSPRRAKVTIPQLEQVKKSKTLQARRSLASLEFGKSVHGSFSIGSSDAGGPKRRLSSSSSSSKSPRSRNSTKVSGKPSRLSNENIKKSASRSSSSKATKVEIMDSGDDLAALIAKHNSKFRPKPKYEPRLHSTRDIREWERRTGLQYYNLQPVERVKVNQEISDYKRSQIP